MSLAEYLDRVAPAPEERETRAQARWLRLYAGAPGVPALRTPTSASPARLMNGSSARNDRAANFNLNGSRVGELTEFLDRDAAFDRVPGKPVEVQGKRDRALTGSTESV